MSQVLDLGVGTVRYVIGGLEQRSLVLRSYRSGKRQDFGNQGYNPIVRIELVDPNMELPPLKPIPLAVVIAKENQELEERTVHEPTAEAIVDALLSRIAELQGQIDKLCSVVREQEDEMSKLRKRAATPPAPPLTEKVRNALTEEQWEALRHGGQR
jgi:hypothetical protein